MNKVKIFSSKPILHKNGKIVVFQKSKKVNFNFKRVFVVKSNANQIRGRHAHKKCFQLLSCPYGKIKVFCEAKNKKKYSFVLNKPEKHLLIPNMTWCVQKYIKKNSVLLVICSEKFSERDYIRSYSKFLNS